MSSTPKSCLPPVEVSSAIVKVRAQSSPPSWNAAQTFLQNTNTSWGESSDPFCSNPLDVQPMAASK